MTDSLHQPKESTITNRILKHLKTKPGFVWKQAGGMYGTAGMPDVVYMRKQTRAVRTDDQFGSFSLRYMVVFGFEVKRNTRKVPIPLHRQAERKRKDATPVQQAVMAELEQAGAMCYVVYSKEEVQEILKGELECLDGIQN